jgi:hypothetical protein
MKRIIVVWVFLLAVLTPSFSQAADASPPGSLKPLAIEVNLLGVLQFGPYVRLHARVAENVYVSPHVRVGYAGALGWLLFDTGDVGVGTSILVFFPSETANRIYAGSFTEVSLNGNGETSANLGANFGYRWRFPGGSYWNTGAIAGLSYTFDTEYMFFFGMLELSWGVEF